MSDTVTAQPVSITVRAYSADIPRLDRIIEALINQNPKASRTDAIRAALDAWERQNGEGR